MDRIAEASLLIDWKFLKTDLIAGYNKIECGFGDEAWAGHLAARVFTRKYGKQDLTVDFIKEVHKRLNKYSNPEKAGKISTTPK